MYATLLLHLIFSSRIIKITNNNNDHKSKREKLHNFENWLQWAKLA